MIDLNNPENKFDIDISKDLLRIDEAFTQIVKDRDSWRDFMQDPNGAMIRVGLHPPASKEANDRANRTFYAALSNKELINHVAGMFEGFDGTEASEHGADETANAAYHQEGLKNGRLQNRVEYDVSAAHHFFEQREAAETAYKILLHDLNENGVLTRKYETDEIDTYVADMVAGVLAQKSLTELPTLETWDNHYGVGTGFGVGEAEIGVAVTAAVPAEGVVAVTVAVLGAIASMGDIQSLASLAARGDSDELQRLSMIGQVLAFCSELMLYAESFERQRAASAGA